MYLRVPVIALLALLLLHAEQSPTQLLDQSKADLQSGHYAEAIDNAQLCAGDFRKAGDTKNLAAALRVIGLARLYSGSYPPAINSLTEALALSRQLHDFGSEIARLNELGTASFFQGRYREALDRFEEAQARVREVPNDQWSPWARQVSTANVAMLYQALGQFDRALALYTGLLDTPVDGRLSARTALAPSEKAQLLSNVGALRRRLGDPVKALETYRTALDLYRGAKQRDGEIAVLNNIGIVQATDLNDLKAAEASFSAALRLAEKGGDRPLAIQARLDRGEALYRAGNFTQSEADLTAAATLSHNLGQQEEEWRALFGLARAAQARGDTPAAKTLLLQAAALIEKLRDNAGTTQLRSAFLADKRAVYDLLIETSPTADEAWRWMEQSRARTLLDQAKAQPLGEVVRDLPRDTAILEFWVGSKSAAVLWISAAGIGMKRWTPDLAAFARINRVLSDPRQAGWREALQPISDTLLKDVPVLADPNIHRLRIVPDGPLAMLPFEALPIGANELLVQKFAISYAPSARKLNAGRPAVARLRWPWQVSLAGFADPQTGVAQGTSMGTRIWTPLPYARTETQAVGKIVGGKTGLHFGADVRKEEFVAATNFPILHLATHAQADLQDPQRSFILLAPASPKTQQYDYLFSKEIAGTSFELTDLVTLSACETQVGVFIPGEGLRGFGEAFLGAGARSVLNSLWSVGDRSTEELMTRFYQRLSSGNSAADALRSAKLDFITHKESSHPAHWAGFVLSGDGDWTLPRLIGWPYLALGFIIAALAVRTGAARVSKYRRLRHR